MATEIRVPALGESVTEATIGRWMKKQGDTVSIDEPIVELETDKVSVEAPAPVSGVLTEVFVQEGDTVEVNALLGVIEASGAASVKSAASPPATEAAVSAGGADIEVRVPAAGESVTEADIGEWLKQVGDSVAMDEPIVSLETDKAAMDVPSPAAGVIKSIAAAEGDTVEVGALLAVITTGAAATATAPKTNGAAVASPAVSPTQSADAGLSPAPRRVVAERGLDPASIGGTGKGGRVTKG
ncbi:MAG: dihydrolipoamide succinyltransferase, partial [Alphaproteobacteria bacterium]|nr:dihydrolipoamide succinyltransferase [Alphaproteobacteria bacterium]